MLRQLPSKVRISLMLLSCIFTLLKIVAQPNSIANDIYFCDEVLKSAEKQIGLVMNVSGRNGGWGIVTKWVEGVYLRVVLSEFCS